MVVNGRVDDDAVLLLNAIERGHLHLQTGGENGTKWGQLFVEDIGK